MLLPTPRNKFRLAVISSLLRTLIQIWKRGNSEGKVTIETSMASNEAQKNLWKEIFLLFDRQGNERITAREIGTTAGNHKRQRIRSNLTAKSGPALRACGFAPTEGEATEMRHIVDPEGTMEDVVDFAKFLTLISRLKPRGNEAEWRDALSVFDKEGDNKIPASDFRYILTNLGEALSDADAEEIMRRVKVENDGNVFIDEYIKVIKGN